MHWSDESRFLLNPVDGRVRVWRQRNTAFEQEHIVGTTAFGGGGVTVWGCFSLTCKIDLYVLGGTLTGQKYRDDSVGNHRSPKASVNFGWRVTSTLYSPVWRITVVRRVGT